MSDPYLVCCAGRSLLDWLHLYHRFSTVIAVSRAIHTISAPDIWCFVSSLDAYGPEGKEAWCDPSIHKVVSHRIEVTNGVAANTEVFQPTREFGKPNKSSMDFAFHWCLVQPDVKDRGVLFVGADGNATYAHTDQIKPENVGHMLGVANKTAVNLEAVMRRNPDVPVWISATEGHPYTFIQPWNGKAPR